MILLLSRPGADNGPVRGADSKEVDGEEWMKGRFCQGLSEPLPRQSRSLKGSNDQLGDHLRAMRRNISTVVMYELRT